MVLGASHEVLECGLPLACHLGREVIRGAAAGDRIQLWACVTEPALAEQPQDVGDLDRLDRVPAPLAEAENHDEITSRSLTRARTRA